MAGRTRAFRWESTSLGTLESWSASLVSTVNFMLGLPMSTILMAGPDLIALYNDAYIPTLAERHPEALGMRGNVLWADAWEAVGHQIEAVFESGTSFRFDDVLIPVMRDGVLTDSYFTYCFSPIFDGQSGAVAGVMCLAQDVTPMNTALLALEANEKKLASVAEELNQIMSATTDSVSTINRQWQITYLNAAAIQTTAAKGHDLIGRNMWQEFPDANYPGSPVVEFYERAMYQAQSGSFETFYPEPLNLWFRISVYPTADGIVSFSRDITEERQTAAALLQTEKLAAVGRLASSIAHEINNPLESVMNLLYLARGTEDMPDLQGYLEMAERELRRVSVIANQTLRFHKQSTAPQAVSCSELFDGVLSIFQGRLVNSHVVVEKRQRAARVVECFEGEIRQVLSNLIGNAVDAMHPAGGRLLLRSRDAHHWQTGARGICLTVADTGTGMPPPVLRKVFSAFYTTKGIGGTGLGLWVSKEIVERHHGTLRVRSSQRPRHTGTVFTLFLPYDAVQR